MGQLPTENEGYFFFGGVAGGLTGGLPAFAEPVGAAGAAVGAAVGSALASGAGGSTAGSAEAAPEGFLLGSFRGVVPLLVGRRSQMMAVPLDTVA